MIIVTRQSVCSQGLELEMEKVLIRGVGIDNVTPEEALSAALSFLETDGASLIFTPNAEILQLCSEDEAVKTVVSSGDLIVPDGSGVVLASRILKTPLKSKVAGIELGYNILKASGEKGYKVYLLGGKPGIAEKAEKKLKEEIPGLDICGCSDGYFTDDSEPIDKINSSGADILLVFLGAPKQEKWLFANREKLNVKLAAGLGGSVDIYAGESKRAPKIFISLGLEWFYRLLKEPKRIGRMMRLPKFVIGTYKEKKERKKI